MNLFNDIKSDSNNKYYLPMKDKSYKEIKFSNYRKVLESNGLFKANTQEWYYKYNRFGRLDPFTHDTYKEFLFFTKPDLNLTNGGKLNEPFSQIPFFADLADNYPYIIDQLQISASKDSRKSPFMYMLSNACTSHLDLPSITADTHVSTKNLMGTEVSYRGHSYKSDVSHDFSLSFTDTNKLDIYTFAKAYDQYVRLCKDGTASPKADYAKYRIIDNQFSVYKIMTLSDAETVVHAAALIGVYLVDVPRADISEPGPDGIKFSLSFHANFIVDGIDAITMFNQLCGKYRSGEVISAWDDTNNMVDNRWVSTPYIFSENPSEGPSNRRHVKYAYKLKWYE